MPGYDYLFKVALRGDVSVGKSNLLSRYASNKFDNGYQATTKAHFATSEMQINGHIVRSQIWDTQGVVEDGDVDSELVWFRGAAGVVLVYDITDAKSFASIPKWLEEARDRSEPNVIIELVGNKSDQHDKRQVSSEEGAKFAAEHDLLFVETSALTTENVKNVFDNLINEIYKKFVTKA